MLKSGKQKAIFASILVIFLIGILAYEGTKQPITVVLNGEEEHVRTHANTVKQLLAELDVNVIEEDRVDPSLDAALTNIAKVTWDPAHPIQLSQNGEIKTIWSTAKTVGEFVKEQQIVLGEHDKISPSIDTELNQTTEIIVEAAFPVVLKTAKEEKEVWTTSTTVADLLKQQEITLSGLDRVEPESNSQVTENMIINVVRVEKVTDVVEVPIDYAVVTRKDTSLTTGTEKVIEKGQKGLEEHRYEVILENGVEVSRTLIGKEKVRDSKDKVVAVGVKPAQPQIARSSDVISTKEFYVTSTAYTAYCNGCSGITATGINLRKNPDQKVIAVDPNVIPLGTKVWVEGYGHAIAGDTGGAIKGHKIDLFIPDSDTVRKYGRKKVLIKLLE
ncbi:G5 and 3D domain-containing protein [Bacillus sp. Marseille-P3661]|uniref:G5 and 3D domain-containing protein n=1 Tax=Bacillus sp. Marseille-P3661 TaxID=1936234 RepID=UPI002155E135|nr:G5 and 3D domain-containing protein [Bacillus sp. Marseille-P3661]